MNPEPYPQILSDPENALEIASKNGYLWWIRYLGTVDRESFYEACGNGHLEIIRYWTIRDLLRNIVSEDTYFILRVLISEDYLEIIRIVFPQLSQSRIDDGFYLSAQYGHLDLLKYFMGLSNGIDYHSGMFMACQIDRVKIVKYIFKRVQFNQDELDEFINIAVVHGNLATVQFLKEKGGNVSQESLYWAQQYGHQSVIDYLSDLNQTES